MPGQILSGVFARRSYLRVMDFFAVALIVALFAACLAFLAGIERL
jgi:CHASE2 domain-containing sensor protein